MKYTFRSEKELQEVIQACAGIPQKVIDNAKYHIGGGPLPRSGRSGRRGLVLHPDDIPYLHCAGPVSVREMPEAGLREAGNVSG